MILRWSSNENDATLAKKSRGWARPSACGQSDPNRIRSTGRCRARSLDVVLDEGRDPAVLDELLDRVRREHARVLTGQHAQRVEAPWHPVRPVLDVGDPQAGEALEELVRDQARWRSPRSAGAS